MFFVEITYIFENKPAITIFLDKKALKVEKLEIPIDKETVSLNTSGISILKHLEILIP